MFYTKGGKDMFLLKQGSRVDYFYKEFYIDTVDELSDIDTTDLCTGSVVYVIDIGAVYMLNSKKEWKLQ